MDTVALVVSAIRPRRSGTTSDAGPCGPCRTAPWARSRRSYRCGVRCGTLGGDSVKHGTVRGSGVVASSVSWRWL